MQVGHLLAQSCGAGDAGFARKMDVHQHHVGAVFRDFHDRLLGRRTGAHAFQSLRAANQLREVFSQRGVVFNDGDFGHQIRFNIVC